MPHATPIRRRNRARSHNAILEVARRQFAVAGYQGATVRGIAAEAGIDPTMVIRYFGSKDGLFAAAVGVDLQLPDLTCVPRGRLGQEVVRHFLRRWEGDLSDDVIGILLRSATTHPAAAQRLREVFAQQILPAVAAVVPDDPEDRAALMASHLLGLALCRYVLLLPPMASADPAMLERRVGATVQRCLTARLA